MTRTAPKIINITTATEKEGTLFTITYKVPRGRKEYTLTVMDRKNRIIPSYIANMAYTWRSLYQAVCKLDLDIIKYDNWDSLL